MLRVSVAGFMLLFATVSFSADQVVVISGGDNPGMNNYSQYLQTKILYDYLSSQNKENTAVYFGAGNNFTTVSPVLDVHKKETVNDFKVDTLLPGRIANNISATKQNVSAYFFSDKAQSLTKNDNLFLFVSDHGLPRAFLNNSKADPFSDNCIDLWNYQGRLVNNFIDKAHFDRICLSKNELTTLVTIPIHPKRVIFVMSQCYSGGFHQMSVTAIDNYPSANPHLCGFTSIDPDHYASGCSPDVSGPTYQGYERSFTEWFTGINIVTAKKIRSPAKSIFEAHENATLEDMTVDVPMTTSDYYLRQWANLFEEPDFISRVAKFPAPQVQAIFNDYKKYIPDIKDEDFKRYQKLVDAVSAKIIEKYPQEQAFLSLSLAEQKKYIKHQEATIAGHNQILQDQMEGMMNLYRNIIFPAWQAAIQDQEVKLTKAQYLMENNFYIPITQQNLYEYPYQFDSLFAQYLSINNNDRIMSDYYRQRFDIIKKWAVSGNNPGITVAVDLFSTYFNGFQSSIDAVMEEEKEKQLLKRIYIYNKISAGWVTLQKIDDKKALNDLAGLLECEHTLML